jgi:hypothetical protein
MELKDLTREQKIALVALLEKVAGSDGMVTEAEGAEIAGVAEALGEDEYRELLNEAEERCPDEKALDAFLGTITDREARELIYGTVLEESLADISLQEGRQVELLRRLADAWNIEVDIAPEEDAAGL